MAADFLIRLREHTTPAVLLVTGEIDTRTLTDFRDTLSRAAARHDRLVIDLTTTGFLSAAALAVLDQHRARIAALLVTRASPILHPLRLAGLRSLLVYSGQPRPSPRAHPPQPRHTEDCTGADVDAAGRAGLPSPRPEPPVPAPLR